MLCAGATGPAACVTSIGETTRDNAISSSARSGMIQRSVRFNMTISFLISLPQQPGIFLYPGHLVIATTCLPVSIQGWVHVVCRTFAARR
jgi:hypothetical protein